jgi:regulation of enolase protein 1 (concanavalin A-like superfamily)
MLHEQFNGTLPDTGLRWLHEPLKWEIENSTLILHTDAGTDFWQKTHYNMQRDSGHYLFFEPEGDFVIETRVRSEFRNQYDQAGLMVRISPHCWIKTSTEFETAKTNRLGAVVTNHGYSDWSTQEVPKDFTTCTYRITRVGQDYMVEYFDREWIQLRMTHLLEAGPVSCGIYACSPKGAGFRALFDYVKIDAPVPQ